MRRDTVSSIAVVVYEGFDELDAVGPYEVFQTAADHGADLDASLVTLAPTDEVTASHGLRVRPDGVLESPDLVVVPGGGWNARASAGAWTQVRDGALPDALARQHERGAVVSSVCTGGMILAAAGLLDGRPAITHAGAVDDLRETDARVVDARVVDDGDVLTAGGVTSGIDLALWLVEDVAGAAIADAVSTTMEYERRGEVYREERA